MENFLEGGIEQLETVKTAISEFPGKEQSYKDSQKSIKAKQKELEIQRKRVDEKIEADTKKARTQLERGFESQIEDADKAIRDAETKKKNAKAAAVSQRMLRENASLVDENKVLKAEIKAAFKEEDVPGFCKFRLYYALFTPAKWKDYIICAVFIIIFAGLIPFLVTRLVDGTFLQVLIWVLIVLVFVGIYLGITAWTKKGDRNAVIRKTRASVERIADNKKFIKKRNKNIKADPDESQYNLFEYDQELELAQADKDRAVSDREAALQNFEEVESIKIRDDIEADKASAFEELQKEIDKMQDDLNSKSEIYQEASREIEEYTELLGDKNMKAEKIDELISLIRSEQASTICQALEVQKTNK